MRFGIMVRNLAEQGGIAVYARALVENLVEIDSSHEFTLYHGVESSVGEFAKHPRVTEVLLPCRNKFWWDQVQVPRDANRRGLDLVFGPKMSLPFFFRGRKSLAMHGAEQFAFPGEFSLADRIYVRVFLPLYARAADVVLTPAVASREDLARELRVSTDRFTVVPYGSKRIYAQPVPAGTIAAVRARYGLEGDFLLHVGLIWGAKNFGVLPAVLDRVRAVRPMVLAHAGKPHRWSDRGAGAQRDDIRSLGHIPDEDLAALYQSATALVFPSLYEGFGIPLVEAMSAGCPVVTAEWGAMREVCEGAAILVDVRDPDAIARAVLRIAEDPAERARLVELGLERARTYTWRETARRTLEVFEALVCGRRIEATRPRELAPETAAATESRPGRESPVPRSYRAESGSGAAS